MKQFFGIALLVVICCSCSSKKDELLSGITQLDLTADSVNVELSEIDPEKADYWYDEYLTVKADLIKTAEKDTVPQNLSENLDNYLTSLSALNDFTTQYEACKLANDSLKKRLKLLRSDVENQRGERSSYERYFKKEELEAKAIRKHAVLLKDQYLKTENAQAQFLPAIERFIVRL